MHVAAFYSNMCKKSTMCDCKAHSLVPGIFGLIPLQPVSSDITCVKIGPSLPVVVRDCSHLGSAVVGDCAHRDAVLVLLVLVVVQLHVVGDGAIDKLVQRLEISKFTCETYRCRSHWNSTSSQTTRIVTQQQHFKVL